MTIKFINLSKFFLIAAVFSVVIVTPFTQYPFVFGKAVFFRTAVELALVFFLLSVLMKNWSSLRAQPHSCWQEWGWTKQSPLVLAVTVFVFVFSLSGFFGYDWQTSFWSNYVRGEGVFQMWHYYIFFILLVLLFQDEKSWRNILLGAIGAGLLSLIFGLPEYLTTYQIDPRFKGAIGNPAFTAIYLSFALFYLIFIFSEKFLEPSSQNSKFNDRRTFSWLAIITSLIFLLAIILGGTRGAFLGLLAGAVIFGFFNLIKYSNFTKRTIMTSLIIPISLIFLLLYWQPIRIFQISLQQQTLQTRLWTWQSAIQGWRERPLLGWGPENFSEVFSKYFDQRHYLGPDKYAEVWFDRAHNVFIDYLTEIGLLGLLAYLAIWTVYYFQLYKTYFARLLVRQSFSVGGSPAVAWRRLGNLFLVFPVVYLIQASLLFETLPAYVNLFLFLALANFKSGFRFQVSGFSQKKNLLISITAIFFIIPIPISFYFGNYLPFRKSIIFISAVKKIDQFNSFEQFKSNFSQALDYYAPYGQDEQLKMLGGIIMDLLKKNPPPEIAKALANYLDQYYQPIIARGRGNIFAQNYYILIQVYQLAGNLDLAKKYQQEAAKKWPARPEFKTRPL